MTVYLFMNPAVPPLRSPAPRRLGALNRLRDELAALPGVQVSPIPQGADLEVELMNVIGADDTTVGGPADHHRILVVRLGRNGERIDFVCSDGDHASAELQAARRIRNWVVGESSVALTTSSLLPALRAIA
jgi:hypothetical protein